MPSSSSRRRDAASQRVTPASAQLYVVPFVEALGTEGQPVGAGRAGEVVLAQVGAIVGAVVLAADEDDAAGEAVLAQRLDGGGAGGAAADHGERALVARVAAGHGHGTLPGGVVGAVDVDVAVVDAHGEGREPRERRRFEQVAGPRVEGALVPGADDVPVVEQPLGQGAVVVWAARPEGAQRALAAQQEDLLAAHLDLVQLALAQLVVARDLILHGDPSSR